MTPSQNPDTERFGGVADLTESDRYRLLAAERRRIVIDILGDRSAPVDLEELAMAVAKREPGVDETHEEAITRVMTSLHHRHLPMMVEADIISYDLHEKQVVADSVCSDIPLC